MFRTALVDIDMYVLYEKFVMCACVEMLSVHASQCNKQVHAHTIFIFQQYMGMFAYVRVFECVSILFDVRAYTHRRAIVHMPSVYVHKADCV
jgi:hypothetical protein